MAEVTVKVEPFKRGNDFLVAGFMDQRGLNVTDREYHAVRDKIMEMRQRDPGAAKLYDKFIDQVVNKRGGTFDPVEYETMVKGLNKQGVSLGPLTNEIASDLKAHKYSPTYRPEVMITVNGKPMVPSVVASQLEGAKVIGTFEPQRSLKPGEVSGRPMAFNISEAAKLAPEPVGRFDNRPMGTKMMQEELLSHSRWKSLSKGLMGVGLAGVAGLAAAAEPGATPASVADAVVATAVPGWQEARKGQACKAFGEGAGYIASGATLAAGTTVTVTAAVGLGAASGPLAPVTAAGVAAGGTYLTAKASEGAHQLASSGAEAACNAAATGYNKLKATLGLGS